MSVDSAGPESSFDDDRPTRSIGRNIGALMSSQVMTWTLALVLVWLVPRYLGPEAYGVVRLSTAIWAIAVILSSFGTGVFATAEIAKNRSAAKSIIAHVIRLRLVLFAAALPIVAVVVVAAGYDDTTILVIAITSVGALSLLITAAQEAGLYGLQEMGHVARVRVVSKVLATVVAVTVLVAGGRLIPLVSANVAVAAVTAILTAWVFARVAGTRTAPTTLRGRTLLAACVSFFAVEAAREIYLQIDTIVISLLVDQEAVGWYAAADTLFGSLLFVPVVVATAIFPAVAELHDRSPAEVVPLLRRSLTGLLIATVPIGIGTVLVAPSFVGLLYGADYDEAAPVLSVFGIVVVLTSTSILLGRFALGTGRAKFWSGMMFIVTAASVPLDIVLVPWTDRTFDNGALGGALAYVVTECLLVAIGIWKLAPSLFTRAMIMRVGKCAVAALAMLAVGWPLRGMFFVIPGAVGSVAYAAVILALRTLNDDEKQMIRGVRARLTRAR